MDSGFEARQQSYEWLVQKVKGGGVLLPTEITTMHRFEQELKSLGLVESFETVEEAAAYTGFSVRTIYNAVKQDELIRQSDGSFSRSEVDAYLAAKGKNPVLRSEEELDEDQPKPGTSAAREETRYRKARADREELLVGKMRGKVLERFEVERQFTARAHEYKTSLLLLSRRCAHKIAVLAGIESKVLSTILDEEAKILLKTLSRKPEIQK